MTDDGCDCCPCCCECHVEREPSSEELAEQRARADATLAARMTPARTPLEQLGRDCAAAMARMTDDVACALYRDLARAEPQIAGLAAVLP